MFYSKVFMRLRLCESKIVNRFYSKNIRARKTTEKNEILDKVVSNPLINSRDDVTYLKHTLLSSSNIFSSDNVDQSLILHFTKNKQFNSSLNYIKFLDEETKEKLNMFLTNQQFLIYFHKRYTEGNLSTSEEKLIIQLYQKLKETSKVLDSYSLERIILGLSVTSEWKICLSLFDDLKKLENQSSLSYSAIIAAAFLNGDQSVAWMLLNEMLEKQKIPNDVIFKAYFEKIGKMSNQTDILLSLDKIFQICNENNFMMTKPSVLELCKVLENSRFKCKDTLVNKKGYCQNCKQKLELMDLSVDEFENLRKRFLGSVLVGNNIFVKSNPVEFSKFQQFLQEVKDCDVVIDGLNVAYMVGTNQSIKVQSTLLANVVSHFVDRGKKVVVLGRKHMESWKGKQWSYIKNNSMLFLTQDLSQDDPYLLYCALYFGKDTVLVSRDLMRSHHFALKDPKDKIIFSRWLEQIQYQLVHVKSDGTVIFKYPREYTKIIQQNHGKWHIPYSIDQDATKDKKDTNQWLCIEATNVDNDQLPKNI